jgi:D-erythronate 2-dehydrogenase
MNILITGGAGFLGAQLARQLLAQKQLALMGQPAKPIDQVLLLDRVAPPADLASDPRVKALTGDLNDLIAQGQAISPDTQLVFHLAAAVSAECEADFDLGMRSNFSATHALLEACRAAGHRPCFVFASSLAVFGQTPALPLPAVVSDTTLPTPQTSYGIQKYIGEQLVADYARKGFVHGRSVRPMTVVVRPGRPNGAASGFFSGMIREPLAGLRASVPVAPSSPVAVASPANTVAGIVRASEASAADWGPFTAINLPSLATDVQSMAQALHSVAGAAATDLLDWQIDARIQSIVAGWPAKLSFERARGLGLREDESFESIVRAYVRENPGAVRISANNAET